MLAVTRDARHVMGAVIAMRVIHDDLRSLMASLDVACAERRWADVAIHAAQLAERLPPRLELLARAMIDFVHENEEDLAAQLWEHLRDALEGEHA